MGAKRLAFYAKQGMTFESPDPPLPLRWLWNANGSVDMRLSPDAHRVRETRTGGQRSLQIACPRGGIEMDMSVIEVVPGATYTFGGWAKGKGNGKITVFGRAFEGYKELGTVNLPVESDWKKAGGKVTIPGNIRTVTFRLTAWQSEKVWFDDLFFCADLPQSFDVDAAMTTKFEKDSHTLLLVDFNGQGDYRLQSAALTDEKGGRFGKGVRIDRDKVSTVGIPLTVKEMPPEGTLEFWFAPDDDPKEIYIFMEVLAGSETVMSMHADTSSLLRLFWQVAQGGDACHSYDVRCAPRSPANGSAPGNGTTSPRSGTARRCGSISMALWWTTIPPVPCRS